MKNAYERRRDHRNLLRAAKNTTARIVKMGEIEHRMLSYEIAYFDLYQVKCKVSYRSGWYWVHNRKVRAEKLEAMTANLLAKFHERELNIPEEV